MKAPGSRSSKLWLDRQENDNEQILQNQDAQGDTAGKRVQLPLVVEHLHDDDRAAERGSDSQVERIPLSGGEGKTDQIKKADSGEGAAEDLRRRGNQDDLPALMIFLRSISRPIMKSRKISPSSEMIETDS